MSSIMVAGPHMIGSIIVATIGVGLVPVVGRDEVRSPAVSVLVGDRPDPASASPLVAAPTAQR